MALGLGAAVFVVGTFMALESAVAVLNVIALVLVAGTRTARGILSVRLVCGALSILSFAVVHGVEPTPSEVIRLGIAMAALVMATALLMRDHAARSQLVAANQVWRRENGAIVPSSSAASLPSGSRTTRSQSPSCALRAEGVSDL